MMTRKIHDDTAMAVIGEFFNVDHNDQKAMSTKMILGVVAKWDSYADELGSNAYALYNTLTDYITHKTYKEDTAATGLLFNQGRLERVLESNAVFA